MTRDCFPRTQPFVSNALARILGCCLLAATMTVYCRSAVAQTDPRKLAAALSGEEQAAADKNPQCKLFTPGELLKFVGKPLAPGSVAALGSGCQWPATSGDGSALIQVVPARYHEPHSGAPGFKKLPDVGTRGFVENDMGWTAGAIVGSESVVVSVTGPAANAATAIALLKETITRKGQVTTKRP